MKILITANLEKVLLSQKKRTKYSIMDSQIYSNIKMKCGKMTLNIKVFFLSIFTHIELKGHGSKNEEEIADSVVKTAFVNPLKRVMAGG